MLGRRFNRLGAAIRQAFNLSRVFPSGSYGGYYLPGNSAYTRQTYNAPAANASSAGDPVGLLMPAQANEAITNLLLWTDAFDNAAWVKSNAAVTANVFANLNGVPTMDRFVPAAGVADHVLVQDVLTQDLSLVRTFAIDLKPDGITSYVIYMRNAAQSIGIQANIDLSAVTATANNYGSPTSTTTPTITALANGGYRVTIGGALSATTETLKVGIIRNYTADGTSGLGVARAQLNLGSTALDYQPNAGSLGGSNRRTGGSNMLRWTERTFNNSLWWGNNNLLITDLSATAADGGTTATTIAPTAASGSLVRYTEVANFTLNAINGVTYTAYVDAKYGTASTNGIAIAVRNAGGTHRARANFNLSTHAVPTITIDGATWTAGTATVTALSNGMYRHSITFTVTTSSETLSFGVYLGTYGSVADTFGSVVIDRAGMNIGSTPDTYSRNMDQLGGLLQSVVPFQGTSANRATLARRPRCGIRNLWGSTGAPTEDFTSAAWSYTAASPTANQIMAPDGTLTADLITANGAASAHWFGAVTSPSAGIQTQSVYAKKGTNNYLQIAVGGSAIPYANFDLNAGTATAFGAGITATITDAGLDFPSLGMGTGWYRCQLYANDAAAVNVRFAIVSSTAAARLESNSLATTVYLWGAQGDLARATASAYQKVASLYDITESGQPDVWETYFDGTSDYLDTGVQSFGAADLSCTASSNWTIWGHFMTFATGGPYILVGRADASNGTFVAIASGGTSMRIRAQSSLNNYGTTVPGIYQCWILRCTAGVVELFLNNTTSIPVTSGSTAMPAENISVAARTPSSPAGFFGGWGGLDGAVERSLASGEVSSLMSYLNNTYRYGL